MNGPLPQDGPSLTARIAEFQVGMAGPASQGPACWPGPVSLWGGRGVFVGWGMPLLPSRVSVMSGTRVRSAGFIVTVSVPTPRGDHGSQLPNLSTG